MTSVKPPPTASLTARALLLGDRDDAVQTLAAALADHEAAARLGGGLSRLTSSASRVVHDRLANLAVDFAEVDVADVLLAGWQRYAALANAARRTLDDPGSEELVDLASHRITSVHHPRVDVLVDDVKVGSVRFALELELLVRALVATVRLGRLTAVEGGQFRLGASLACFDVLIAQRQEEFDLGLVLDLRSGVPIVPAHGHTPAP